MTLNTEPLMLKGKSTPVEIVVHHANLTTETCGADREDRLWTDQTEDSDARGQ